MKSWQDGGKEFLDEVVSKAFTSSWIRPPCTARINEDGIVEVRDATGTIVAWMSQSAWKACQQLAEDN